MQSGNSSEIRKFFTKDLRRAIQKDTDVPGKIRTVSFGRPSTGTIAIALMTRSPNSAFPGVAPPVRPLLLKQLA